MIKHTQSSNVTLPTKNEYNDQHVQLNQPSLASSKSSMARQEA